MNAINKNITGWAIALLLAVSVGIYEVSNYEKQQAVKQARNIVASAQQNDVNSCIRQNDSRREGNRRYRAQVKSLEIDASFFRGAASVRAKNAKLETNPALAKADEQAAAQYSKDAVEKLKLIKTIHPVTIINCNKEVKSAG